MFGEVTNSNLTYRHYTWAGDSSLVDIWTGQLITLYYGKSLPSIKRANNLHGKRLKAPRTTWKINCLHYLSQICHFCLNLNIFFSVCLVFRFRFTVPRLSRWESGLVQLETTAWGHCLYSCWMDRLSFKDFAFTCFILKAQFTRLHGWGSS